MRQPCCRRIMQLATARSARCAAVADCWVVSSDLARASGEMLHVGILCDGVASWV
jgi:hypothetical protein